MKFTDIIKLVEENPFSAFFYTPSIYPDSKSFVLKSPFEIINVYEKNDLQKAFKLSDKLISKGAGGYCLIDYEAGYLFEKKLEKLFKNSDRRVIQFFFFKDKNIKVLDSAEIEFENKIEPEFKVNDFKLNTSIDQFKKNINRIKKYIREGDTYQVNYTLKGKFGFSDSLSTLYKNLLFNQSAKYSAFINNGKQIIISLSPELFFKIKKNKIHSQPMKGTIKRGFDADSDILNETELTSNEKDKAENVMIVDMIRNDLGRISRYGSVTVPELFKTEKYESLFQMISTIEGKLNKKIKLSEVIKSIFPCGSVTGAPKIRTMEIINELEKEPRGIYTGSIGLFTRKELIFNVAIRTLSIDKKKNRGEIGMGAGIVWDSNPESEFEESLLKSKFLTHPDNYFELLETMLCVNGQIEFLDEHLERLKNSAQFFLFKFDETAIKKLVEDELQKLNKTNKYKIRLTLNKWGSVTIKINEVEPLPSSLNVIVSEKRINSSNKFQHFKTTNRKLYDEEYSKQLKKGFFETLFLNENEEVVEGSRTNIFVRKGNKWITTPLNSGALPGIFRNYFLNKQSATESKLLLDDILSADEVWLTNSIIKAVKINKIILKDDNLKV